jgi:hypothetical protein
MGEGAGRHKEERKMNSSIKMLLMAMVIAALTCAGSIAQDHGVLRAGIPFDFMVGNQKVPAGEYTFTRGAYPVMMQVCTRTGDKCFAVLYHASGVNKTNIPNVLVFHSFGDKHFLKEVWSETGYLSVQLGKSRAEKEETARNAVRTTVAASLAR